MTSDQAGVPITIHSILAEFRDACRSNRELGDSFERLIAAYLVTDPMYADRFDGVWLWGEWPHRWGADTGIDLVARERLTGDYCAIQCKFYLPEHTLQKGDIDAFFTASGKRFATTDGAKQFTSRIVVSTTDKWSVHAEGALSEQTIPATRLRVQELEDSPIDWSSFAGAATAKLKRVPKKVPFDHQADAIRDVTTGFKTEDRGKLIMACGTGKTFTALKIAEKQTDTHGLVLFLVPSISLLAQSLREWSAEASSPFHAFAVCSDTKVGKDQEDISAHDLAYPSTTDAKKLALHANLAVKDRRTVVFSTYQSIQVVADAQRKGLGEFDLIICDEAHRTTGITVDGVDVSDFVKVHDNKVVKGKKRLYMTATPRIFAEASKKKADDSAAILYSMDDPATYGPQFYRIGFGKAVEKGLLSDYKVLIVAVDEDRMARLANEYNSAFRLDEKQAIDTKFAVRIIGSWKGLSKKGLMLVGDEGDAEPLSEDTAPMKRAVAFSRSIKDSKSVISVFSKLVEVYNRHHGGEDSGLVDCALDHVDGSMNALVRLNALKWLKEDPGEGACRVLSNARCLSEGIDVPALDSVVFFDTRESIVDIVQSVGRVMRKADGKQYGYIILPVGIPSKKVQDYNAYVESDPQFKSIWKIIKALRAHDESLVDEAEFKKKVKVATSPGGGETGGGEQLPIAFPMLPIDDLTEAVYAAIPKKLGDREYWSEWAKSVAQIAERLIARIHELLDNEKARRTFDKFLAGLQKNLNPSVREADAIEMLAQHILTRPVFEALFAGHSFTKSNPVSKSMQAIIKLLDDRDVGSEAEGLEKFYANVRDRVALAKSDKSRQEVIRNLYDTFFQNAFPRVRDKLGIVYTPVPVVDFILRSAEFTLRKHFGTGLTDKGVQIIDPFTGTGTFIVRLLQSGLIQPTDLTRKYQHELHANEIVLLAYYIAAINIEAAYHSQVGGEYEAFEGIVLTDTFQMDETRDLVDAVVLPENSERVNRQKKQDIRVVVGNPPYSAQQDSESDNNQNIEYPTLDARIRDTYVARSVTKLHKNLYDSYIRAIRWAADRIKSRGVVAFVTNGSFVDANNMAGLRLTLTAEFSHLYVFNLRGDQRTAGEASKREGGKIFGSGSRTPVAITVMVKDPTHEGACELHYFDIGDYLSREEKLAMIESLGSTNGVQWQRVTPNTQGDWINQRDPAFDAFIPLGSKGASDGDALFSIYSLGVVTNRDPWVYGHSSKAISENVRRMLDVYNREMRRYQKAIAGISDKAQRPDIESVVVTDTKKISWTRGLKADASRGKDLTFNAERLTRSMYRPFTKQWLYFDRRLNEMVYQIPRLFPTPHHVNVVISCTGVADRKGFSALASNIVPAMHLTDTGQCFPLYWYDRVESDDEAKRDLFGSANAVPDQYGYVRRDAISDHALGMFRSHYDDEAITKEDMFWYVYGVLHSSEYRSRFAADLKKMLPRIPFAADFRAFSDAGRALGRLHTDYEALEPYPVTTECRRLVMEAGDYRVTKMTFGKKSGRELDRSVIHYNDAIRILGIPLEAYEYVVNGKSAIEWVMERYALAIDRASGIKNDPNDWSDDPQYILNLLKRVIRVSVESARIVKALPPLNERKQ